MDLKKILAIVTGIIAAIGFYFGGKALGINVIGEFAPYIATAIVGWVIYIGRKWFNIKLDFLNNELIKQKAVESIIWAEGKAIEKFKFDSLITEGKKKANWAASQLLSSIPGIDAAKASELVGYYFPQVRPIAEKMWAEFAEEMKTKSILPKK